MEQQPPAPNPFRSPSDDQDGSSKPPHQISSRLVQIAIIGFALCTLVIGIFPLLALLARLFLPSFHVIQ